MDEASPAEAGAAPEKKRPFLRRVPTSLVVTLVGIALTAWLLPAFTRQWDDRQKAQEVRAAIASQIAVETAHALLASNKASRALLHSSHYDPRFGYSVSTANGLDDIWLGSRIAIETKLRAYFSAEEVYRGLDQYNVSMSDVFAIASGANGLTARQLQEHFGMSQRSAKIIADDAGDGYMLEALGYLNEEMLNEENRFVGEIFDAHVAGYSTTSHDLLHDLIP